MNQIKGKIKAGKVTGSIGCQKIGGSIGSGVDYYKGKDGYTPIKGVDYFTDEDIREISSKIDIPPSYELATELDMSDWDSGKVVDAEALRTDFIEALGMLQSKADSDELATVAFTGDYNDLINKPSGGGADVEKVDYYLAFDKISGMNGVFTITNPKEDVAEMIADFREGKANFIRELTLTYEPLDTLPKAGTILPSYDFCGDIVTNNAGTGHAICYRRIIGFTSAQTQQYVDIIIIMCNISTNKIIYIQHKYVPMFDTTIISSDYSPASYPAPLTITSSGGLWGKQNPATLKVTRAGYASDFNFKLRVNTGGYNVWLNPVEASPKALPIFIGESDYLGKRIVAKFDDFTDEGHPTGTIYRYDLITEDKVNALIDAKLASQSS